MQEARELRLQSRSTFPPRRRIAGSAVEHYKRCPVLLRERLPDSPLVSELDAELTGVSTRP